MRLVRSVFTLSLAAAWVGAQAEITTPLLIHEVAVSRDQLVFSWNGQLWTVPTVGGQAKPLLKLSGFQRAPSFSPDGKWLAFSADVGGNLDVYVMAAGGGDPRRLTYHPKQDMVQNWSPDSRSVLFMSGRERDGKVELYTIGLDEANPRRMPPEAAAVGAISPDGTALAYSRDIPSFSIQRRFYRGGSMSELRLLNLRDNSERSLKTGNWNVLCPMWVGDHLYHLSDKQGSYNLARFDFKSGKSEELTKSATFGSNHASMGGGNIAYTLGGKVFVRDIASGTTHEVPIRINESDIPTGMDQKAKRTVPVDQFIESLSLGWNGESAVMQARGDVWFKGKEGGFKNLTGTSGVAERLPSLSPDGTQVAYFCDESGEYAVHVAPVVGGTVRKFPVSGATSFRELTWSPDGKRLAFSDLALTLRTVDLSSGQVSVLDRSNFPSQENWQPKWHPSGRYLAYAKQLENRVRTLFIWDSRTGQKVQVTDGYTPCEAPAFDAGGAYLYFISSARGVRTLASNVWALESSIIFNPISVSKVFAVSLVKGVGGMVNPIPSASTIDLEGVRDRIFWLPMRERPYRDLKAGKPGVLFLQTSDWGEVPGAISPTTNLARIDFSGQPRLDTLAKGIVDYEVSGDGSTVLAITPRGFATLPANAEAATEQMSKSALLVAAEGSVEVDPTQEWRQIYKEAFRLMRDKFYDPNHHGQDLKAIEKHYEAYLPSIRRRSDLNQLLTRAFGDVSISHLQVGGGDDPSPRPQGVPVGLLGADVSWDGKGYKIGRIYRSGDFYADNPLLRSPFAQAASAASEGEYIWEVDGTKLEGSRNFYSYFIGKLGPIKLRVGSSPEAAREITVTTLAGENSLRAADWARRNAEYVEKKSGGRLAYVWVSGWNPDGYDSFYRGVNAASVKEGLIVDERFNGGGVTSDMAISTLAGKTTLAYDYPYGNDFTAPPLAGPSSKVLIINQANGSAAETFALMWKNSKLGPVVGLRTYGGGVGGALWSPQTIDGGSITIPTRGGYNPITGQWEIENDGVRPDHEVSISARDFAAGRDPQLDKAIELALAGAVKPKLNRPAAPKHPK
jgi:tricorn protease